MLCSTADCVINQIHSRNPARTNFCGDFHVIPENNRPGVFNTSSLVIDCEIEDAKTKKCISVADILTNVFLGLERC
jgi:hypothetical protein